MKSSVYDTANFIPAPSQIPPPNKKVKIDIECIDIESITIFNIDDQTISYLSFGCRIW